MFSIFKQCEGLGEKDQISIRIEPGFYQYVGWEGVQDWCTPEELHAAKFNIDLGYVPIVSRQKLLDNLNRTMEEHYNGNYECIQTILSTNGKISFGLFIFDFFFCCDCKLLKYFYKYSSEYL